MSGSLSTTVVQPLVQTKSRTVNAISSAVPTPFGSPKTGGATPRVQPPPSPGTWQHPKLREITRRQAATRFGEQDVKIVGTNAAVLLLSVYFREWLHTGLSYVASPIDDFYHSTTVATYTINLFRLYILLNIVLTLRPLSPYLQKQDDLADIPLTPSQRSLLGLPASPTTGSPVSGGYVTPPRYRRSSSSSTSSTISKTPQSGRSISANYASSPLSTSRYTLGFSPGGQSPFRSTQRTASGSPFSPSASPLLHKAIGRGMDREVQEFNASTGGFSPGLSRSQSMKERTVRDVGEPGTPSPGGFGGVKRDGGLNYKWLYQTGRGPGGRIPKSESMNF